MKKHQKRKILDQKIITNRFISKIEFLDGCWIWTRSINKVTGYGYFSIKGKIKSAHRTSYELFIGEIPENYVIDHLCNNKLCVNPNHLECVTQNENLKRAIGWGSNYNSKKKLCSKGHEYTKVEENGRIRRICKTCKSEQGKDRRLRIKEKNLNV